MTATDKKSWYYQIGNEFSSVESLWSQFEKVMGRDQEENAHGQATGAEGQEQETTDDGNRDSTRDRDHHGE
ncbi:Dolichyl-diphosphooligosaccharide-protein glycosyltransferase subunit dad1 [Exophiala dermatitidis]|nr:Dolichyl-diphosphooligosaccharide-protein glycosyltransferase subunit dad1 [Exophiala dermatitidis]